MKRCLILLLTCVLAMSAGTVPALAEETASEEALNAALNQTAFEADGTMMVPLRAMAEGLGARITWDFTNEIATVTYLDTTIKLREGQPSATVNGAEVPITQPVQKVDGLLYAPVRFVGETLGFTVTWNETEQSVHISTQGPADTGHLYKVVGVSASEDDGNKPEGVLDRNYQTRWSAETNGAYITLELDDIHPVAYIGVANYNGDERQETLSVQVSADGQNFQEVVTKFVVPELTLAMVPVDLGAVYDAKYVRVVGYGNTKNAWNSFTEISVYGPMEDGSMPVATDGPGASTGDSLEDLSAEQKAALARFEELFTRLDVWYANLYHHEDGGIFMTMSGRDDPEMECGLEMTFYALSGVRTYSDAWLDMPDHVKQRFIDYILERQDPATGMFIDHQGPVNDRETARNQACVMGWVNTWKIDLPYEHPSQKTSGGGSTSATDTTVMPAYMASVSSYLDWVENNWDWDRNSWTAGDQTQQSLNYLNYLPKEQYEQYKAALLEWLANRQFDDTGFWAPTVDFNSVSGAFKVGLIYQNLGEKIPNAEKVMETTIRCMETVYPDRAHYVRNPISLLQQIAGYKPEYAARIQQAVTDNMENICGWMEQFLAPDGGFAMYHGRSMSNFGGIYSSHELWEGDVDSTLMILIARKGVYNLMGVAAPLLEFDDNFWNWIDGSAETPSPYIDESIVNGEGGDSEDVQDFEDAELGPLTGAEFGGSQASGMTLELVKDQDRRDNKCVSVSYDGSLASGPVFSVKGGGGGYLVRYLPSTGQETVVEFDVKLKNMNSGNSCYIGLGTNGAYNLNFQGGRMGTRIDSTNVQYGGTFATLRENEWYRIRVEYRTGKEKEDFQAKIYVDGELVSTNRNYNNMLAGTPGDAFGGVSVTWYRTGSGTVLLDNIMMRKTQVTK